MLFTKLNPHVNLNRSLSERLTDVFPPYKQHVNNI